MSERIIEYSFSINLESAHSAMMDSGLKEKVHGHEFKITVILSADVSKEHSSIALQAEDFKHAMAEYEYFNLNELKETANYTLSAETLAHSLYKVLTDRITDMNIEVISVSVEEEPDCAIEYSDKADFNKSDDF